MRVDPLKALDDLRAMIAFHCMDVPTWAKYAAVDANGGLYVYGEPVVVSIMEAETVETIWIPLREQVQEGYVGSQYSHIYTFKQDISELWLNSLVELV